MGVLLLRLLLGETINYSVGYLHMLSMPQLLTVFGFCSNITSVCEKLTLYFTICAVHIDFLSDINDSIDYKTVNIQNSILILHALVHFNVPQLS